MKILKPFFIPILVSLTIPISLASAGFRDGGGGDPTEATVYDIRQSILDWINSGDAAELSFPDPQKMSYEKYVQLMTPVLLTPPHSQAVVVSFVTTLQEQITHDPEQKVDVNGKKTCRWFRSVKDKQIHILCNSDRFPKKSEEQFQLIHHEFAGIAGVEKNLGAASDYEYSNQLSDFATFVKTYKLGPKKTSETGKLLSQLAHRPGLHVVMEIKPSLTSSAYPQYGPAGTAIKALSLSSENPRQVETLATYLDMPGNECTIKTLRSLNDLLEKKGAHFDALSRANFDSAPGAPEKPGLEDLQKIKVSGDLFSIGYFIGFPQDEADLDLILYGCQPGTRRTDANGKINCQPVAEDFDYTSLVYKHPLKDIYVSVPYLDSRSDLMYRSASTWILKSHNMQMLKGMTWAFRGGGTIADMMESAFIDSLRHSNQLASPTDFESRCEIGPGLMALLFGKSEEDVEAGYKIP